MPAGDAGSWTALQRRIVACQRCPRLRSFCAQIAREKRRSYANEVYWGKPVPNFGDPKARLLIVGLAPAAHGGNRTGRMFTGDRSGDWLYRALHRAGFASQSESRRRDDGLTLIDCAITAVCHCAPPQNRPLADEIANCHEWLAATWSLLPLRAVVSLGQIAWRATFAEARRRGIWKGGAPPFAHGRECELSAGILTVASYHPSQQNTFTGRLTEEMLDTVFLLVRKWLFRS